MCIHMHKTSGIQQKRLRQGARAASEHRHWWTGGTHTTPVPGSEPQISVCVVINSSWGSSWTQNKTKRQIFHSENRKSISTRNMIKLFLWEKFYHKLQFYCVWSHRAVIHENFILMRGKVEAWCFQSVAETCWARQREGQIEKCKKNIEELQKRKYHDG